MSSTLRNVLTDTQPLPNKQQNSVSRCHAFILTENTHKDFISGSYLYEKFLELIMKNQMHILWRFSSLFPFVTPSRNRLNCFRNKVNMKEILSNLFSTFKSIRQNNSHFKKQFQIKKDYSEICWNTKASWLHHLQLFLIKPSVYVSQYEIYSIICDFIYQMPLEYAFDNESYEDFFSRILTNC